MHCELLFPFIQTAPVFLAVCESYFVESRQYYRAGIASRGYLLWLCVCVINWTVVGQHFLAHYNV